MASYPRANPYHAYPVDADRNLVGTYDRNEALRELKNRSASPYASSSFRPPMNRETPVSNVAPVANQQQTAPMAMPQSGLLGGSPIGGGLLAASNVLSQAGMNSPMPQSLGSAIGPALNAFSQGYAQDQQTAIKRAREQALINKYGPEALVSGAIPALIAANAEKKASEAKTKQLNNLLGIGTTQGEQEQPNDIEVPKNLNAPASVPKFNEEEKEIIAFAKNPGDGVKTVYANRQEKYKLAVTRVAPARKNILVAQTGIAKVKYAVKQKDGTADIAAVNAYQRLIDPGVVKGEDITLQKEATSLGLALRRWANQAKTGEILPEKVRNRMLNMANLLGKAVIEVNREEILGQKDRFEMNEQLDWRRVWPKRWDALISTRELDSGSTNSIKKGTFK